MDYIESFLDANASMTIPERLNGLGMKEAFAAFQEMLECPGKIQDTLLGQIISHAKDSKFGSDHNFSDIHSYEDFVKEVPVLEYADFLPYIEDICQKGDNHQLYERKIEAMISTSGTTGKFKLFPESDIGAMAKNQVTRLRTVVVMGILGEAIKAGGKTLAVSNYSDRGRTQSGIQVMAASGFTMRQVANADPNEAKLKWDAEYVLPYDLVNSKNLPNDVTDYVSALFMLKAHDLIAICSNNLDHIGVLLTCIENNYKQLIGDLKSGEISYPFPDEFAQLKASLEASLKTIKEGRADEVDAIFSEGKGLQADKLWPKLILVYCWLAGSVGRAARDVARRLPQNVPYIDIGYGASEGKFNIPMIPGNTFAPMAPCSVFFEFKPIGGGQIVTAENVEDGRCYELIITTFSGLYRYNLHDLVKICGKTKNTPNIEFVGKASESLQCDGKTVYAKDFMEAIKQTESELDVFISFFQCFKTDEEKIGFIIQMDKDDACRAGFKDVLAANLLKNAHVGLDKVYLMKQGYRDSLYRKKAEGGVSVNATKLALIVKEAPDTSEMIEDVY